MRNTKLILIEGIPGSGKSTLAQFIAHALTQQGIDCQWRYEEEKDHPLENNALIVDGMSQVWPRTLLIQRSNTVFAVESLPFQVTFEEDAQGVINGVRVTGPALLFGKVDRFFVREEDP